jgi:hypothetical protein
MPAFPLTVWLILVMWATTTAVFVSKMDRRKLAIVVILLSLLVLASLVRGRVHTPATTPTVRFVLNPYLTAPIEKLTRFDQQPDALRARSAYSFVLALINGQA